ncbi:MAG: hypothetical protein DIZ80_02495 [endosymbiont of Galathealinum brachiosum]|uniref:Uncharacterized protein n=1 Tax=endosymbiont of Galathealinum brachiosum TaxID=2200906 RepID=A0A370DMD1_9GAMM|nr:MAG: hypothetical protein DIZ80_02495 [endosymbiont of Galathealinum brachiosum]
MFDFMCINNKLAGFLFLSTLSPCLLAADMDDFLDMSLEQLVNVDVFTASKKLEKADTAPSTIYVVTEEEISRNGYYTLEDVLENIPGVSTINSGFFLFGGQRGFLGNFSQTLILIDGREMQNLLAAETFISNQFSTHNIKQVEVINGPGSVLYGANAYVGVINIITKQGDKEFNDVEISLDAGTQDTNAYSAVFAKSYGDLRIAGSVRVASSDNWDFSEFVNDTQNFSEGFPVIVQNGNNALSPGEGYRNTGKAIPLSFRIDFKEFYFGFESYNLQSGKGLENVALDYNAQEDVREFENQYIGWDHDLTETTHINLEYQHYREKLWGTNYSYDQSIFDDLVANGRDPNAPLTDEEIHEDFVLYYSQENSSGSERHRFNAQIDTMIANDWSLIAGYTFDQLDVLGVAISRDDPVPAFDETVSFDNALRRPFYKTDKHSLYAQLKKSFFDNVLHMTLGGRVDDQEIYGAINTFRGGLVFQATESTNYKLLYGQAFREPNIFEQGANNDPDKPFNDDLKPATIDTYELAVNHRIHRSLKAQLVFFHSVATDLLKPASTVDFVNSGEKIVSEGLESQIFYKYKSFSGDLSYTYTNPEDVVINGETIKSLNISDHRLSLGLNYDVLKAVRLNARVNYFSDLQAEHGNPDIEEVIDISSATQLDLTLSTRHFNYEGLKLSFMLTVKNALNEEQYLPNVRNGGPMQFLQPGRQIISRLSFMF